MLYFTTLKSATFPFPGNSVFSYLAAFVFQLAEQITFELFVLEVHRLFPDNSQEKKKLQKSESNDLPGLEAVYLSDISPRDKPWDEHRANSQTVHEMYLELGKGKYSLRIDKCSRLLEFALKQDFDEDSLFKLQRARFCRVRFCPVCQWRRTLMWRSRFYKAIPAIRADYPTFKFLFLTLTVKNCEVEELRQTVKWMRDSWRKLVARKRFPARGWIRAVEVTKANNGLAHPHLHCVLIVPNNYFTTKDYVTKDEWIKLWQKSLKVDYEPSVNIKKVKLSESRKANIENRLGKELTDNDIVFYGLMECLKYSVKESDLISEPQWLDAITCQLHRTRAIALGGIFKEYLSEDEPEDLINVDTEQDIEILETDAKFMFGWNEKYKRYRSI